MAHNQKSILFYFYKAITFLNRTEIEQGMEVGKGGGKGKDNPTRPHNCTCKDDIIETGLSFG